MKKFMKVLLPSAIAVICCAACAKTGESDKVEIEFWHNYAADTGQVDTLNTLIGEFEKENPNVTVNPVYQEWSALQKGVTLGASSGVLPDVLRGDIAFVPQFQSLNVLEEVGAYSDYAEVAGKVLKQPNSSNLMNGKYYGIACNTNTKVLFYNKTILDAHSVKAPETLDGLWSAAAAVSGNGVTGYVEPWTGVWNVGPYIWSEGGDILSSDNKTANGYLNGAVSVAVITKLHDMYAAGSLTGSSLNNSVLGDTDGWAQGKYAFELDGPWRASSCETAKIDYGAMPLPAGKAGSVSVLGGENLMLFKHSSDTKKKAAWAFAKYMVSEHAQVEMAKHGQMPVNTSALTDADALNAMPLLPTFIKALSTARARPVIPQWSKVEDVIASKVAEAITGATPVKTALDDAVTQIDVLLAK